MSGLPTTSMAEPVAEETVEYRSLCITALLSFVFGLLSLLSFAPFWLFMVVFPPAAIVTGIMGLRKIADAPQEWSGKRLAQLGIVLAIGSVVASAGWKAAERSEIQTHSRAVADRFLGKLKAGDLEGAYWLMMPKETRTGIANLPPDKLPQELPQRYAMFRAQWDAFSEQLQRGDTTYEFDLLEETGFDRGVTHAALRYHLHTPNGESHMLIVASAMRFSAASDWSWFIRECRLDYQPNSEHVGPDRGHGHSH